MNHVARFVSLFSLIMVGVFAWSCGGSTDPTPSGLAGFELALPDSVDAGTSFPLTVTAIKGDGTKPYTAFSGTVALSASTGNIQPGTLTVTEGYGEVQVKVSASGGAVKVQARSGGAAGSRTLVVRALNRLPGNATDPAVTAIPRIGYTAREEDFSTGHPDFPDALMSFNTVAVVFHAGTTVGQANALFDEVGVDQIVAGLPGIGGEAAGYVFLRLATETHEDLEAALAVLRASDRVRIAVQDMEIEESIQPRGDNQPLWDYNFPISFATASWGMQLPRFPQAWNLLEAARKAHHHIDVGVLDSGFCPYPDNELVIVEDLAPGTGFGTGDHGNHVAGTMAAQWNGRGVDGIIPDAGLVVLGAASGLGVIDGIPAMVEARPDLRVINISLGLVWGTYTNPNTNVLAQAHANSMGDTFHDVMVTLAATHPAPLIVVATGNDSDQYSPPVQTQWTSPMTNAEIRLGDPYVLGVEAVSNNPLVPGGAQRATFSNIGGDVSGPGVGITSTICSGYATYQGTSMASPHVAGLAGLLWYLAPSLPLDTVKSLIKGGAVPVPTPVDGAPAAKRIDAWNSVMLLNQILGGDQILRNLCDIDDGSADGNQRVVFDNPSLNYDEDDEDGDGGWGDGEIDMSDFRMFRDHLLMVEQAGNIDFDGTAQNHKFDLNRNRVLTDPDGENVYPRTDFNGDGIVSRDSTIAMAGVFNGEQKTDLDVLKRVFDDPNYDKADLDSLLDSGDITVWARNCLSINVVDRVKSWVTDSNDMTVDEREHVDEKTSKQVYTLPEDIYTVHVQAFDDTGMILDERDSSFTVVPGSDDYWEPNCETVLVEAQMAQQLETGTPSPVLVRAGYVDAGGAKRYVEGMQISMSAVGGTVSPSGGVTNSEGFMDASEVTLTAGHDLLTLFVTAKAPSGAENTVVLTANRYVPCENDREFTTRGDGTIEPGFGEVEFSGKAGQNAEWLDSFTIIPADSTLLGSTGTIVFKVRIRVETTGYSGVNPSVRTALWPRDKPWGTQFVTYQWTTPGSGDPINVDDEREVRLAAYLFSPTPISMRTQAFANDDQNGFTVKASHEIMGIEKVLGPDGNPITVLAICTASGKVYPF